MTEIAVSYSRYTCTCGATFPTWVTLPITCARCGLQVYEPDICQVEKKQLPAPEHYVPTHWAHHLWEKLHLQAARWTRRDLIKWAASIPCGNCRASLTKFEQEDKFPEQSSASEKLLWSWRLHNWVNQKLNKKELPVQDAAKLWSWDLTPQ